MRFAINMIAAMILLSNIVFAGNIYPVDFSQQEEKTMELAVKEGAEFIPIKGFLIVEAFKADGGIDMKLVLTDGRVWGLVPLKKLASVNIDVDRDNDDDLVVLLREVVDNKATISFKEVRDDVKQTNPITETTSSLGIEGSPVPETSSFKRTGILIVLAILAVGVLVYFFFIKKR